MPAVYYPAVIERTADGFGVHFPDFPLVITGGVTIQEAAMKAEEGLAFHIDSMRGDGDAIPSPSDLDSIEPVEGANDVAHVLIPIDMPGKFQRIQVTIEESLLARIDKVSHNRSGFLADAARVALEARIVPQQSGALDEAIRGISNQVSKLPREMMDAGALSPKIKRRRV